jgi:hypothetical protein
MMSRGLALISCLAGGLLVAAAVYAQTVTWQSADEAGQGQTPVMPVHQEPHHRQVFQYGPMRIIDLQIPPGDMSWFHTHEWPVFYLTVADSQTRTQILGEEWGARGRGAGAGAAGRGAPPAGAAPAGTPPAGGPPPGAARAGAPPAPPGGAAPRAGGPPRFRPRLFSDLSYAERAVTHRIHNNGTGLYRALGVINETQGGDESVTEQAAGFSGKAEMSNRWFRIHRVALAPGEKAAHQHKAPVVVLQDSAGKGAASGPMAFELSEPGSWAFFDSGARHEIANSGPERLEVIEVEIRRR